MKPFAWIVLGLALLAVLLALPLVTRRTSTAPECSGRVVVMRGPDGAPIECVCVQSVLATCFNPGP